MCCCGTPTINGQEGYRWNNPEGPSGIHPVNPPALEENDLLLFDEPGRCGGLDAHCHHYRLVVSLGGLVSLLVRHGSGDERVTLSSVIKPNALTSLDSNTRYWLFHTIFHAYSDGRHEALSLANRTWKKAAAEKRIKTRKLRGADAVKVWIENANVTDMRATHCLDRGHAALDLLLFVLLLLATVAGVAAGAAGGYQRGFKAGERSANTYVEDCGLQDAHKGLCVIPCTTDADCEEKNGTLDAY